MTRTHQQCRRCGFGIPADAPLCPGCRRPAVDDWAAKARHLAAVERRARRLDPPLHRDGYRSLLPAATTARAGLSVSSAVAATVGVLHAVSTVGDPATASIGTTTVDAAAMARAATAGLVATVALTAASFVAWAVRAYRNLPALGITDRRYWTIWLVVGWAIPGANLLVPKLVVDDLWRASSPNADGDTWHRRPVASVVNRWWCSFLLSPSLAVLAVVATRGGLGEVEARAAVGAVCVAAAASIVVAGLAARRLVAVVTVAQARRADVIVDIRDDQQAAEAHRGAIRRATA